MGSPFVSGCLVLDFIVPGDCDVAPLEVLLEGHQARVALAEELDAIEQNFSASRPLRLPGEQRLLAGFDAFSVPQPAPPHVMLDLRGPVWLLTDAVVRDGARLGSATFWGWASPFAIAGRGIAELGALALFLDVHTVHDTDLDPARAIADREARFATVRGAIDPEAIAATLPNARWSGDVVTVDVLEADGTLVRAHADALIDRVRAACPPW